MIHVCFFADLRERLQCAELDVETFNGNNVSDLLDELLRLHPHWQATLVEKKWLVAVNHVMATLQTPLTNSDEVAFFPPVTGG